jgi:hypothetical protein
MKSVGSLQKKYSNIIVKQNEFPQNEKIAAIKKFCQKFKTLGIL